MLEAPTARQTFRFSSSSSSSRWILREYRSAFQSRFGYVEWTDYENTERCIVTANSSWTVAKRRFVSLYSNSRVGRNSAFERAASLQPASSHGLRSFARNYG